MKVRSFLKYKYLFIRSFLKTTLFRYLVAGTSASLLDILIFNSLIYLSGTYYILAAVISNTLSFFVRFFLQKHYAFKSHEKKGIQREFFAYTLLFVAGIIFTSLLMYAFVDKLYINESLAQIFSIIIIAGISFFVYRFIVFPNKERKEIKRILIFTQKVDRNDTVLGFFHSWIIEFSKVFDKVRVVCLEKGEYDLPDNVSVFSLGKEERQSRLQYLIHFYWYVLYERNNYDAVFVHMNKEYVILGGVIWKLMNKKIFFWRNHKVGNFITDISVFLSNKVFCTSASSYTAKFKKTTIMPVGINTDLFVRKVEIVKKPRSILSIGRIAPVKKIEILIEALSEIKKKGVKFETSIYGDPLEKDIGYFESLKNKVIEYKLGDTVFFYPGVSNEETVHIYNSHETFVNLSLSGAYDKTIFEAMACESLICASSLDLKNIIDKNFIFEENNHMDLANRLEYILNLDQTTKENMGKNLRNTVIESHSLKKLVEKIKFYFE